MQMVSPQPLRRFAESRFDRVSETRSAPQDPEPHPHRAALHSVPVQPDRTRVSTVGRRLGTGAVLLLLSVFPLHGTEVVTEPSRSFGLGSVQALALAPDGRRLATAGQTGAFLWSTTDGRLERQILNIATPVLTLAFAPDGGTLISGSRHGALQFWDPATGERRRSIAAHVSEVTDLAFAPDGLRFASASGDNTVKIWSVETGELVRQFEIRGVWMRAVEFTADGRRVVSVEGAPSYAVRVWNLESGNQERLLEAGGQEIFALRRLGDGRIATAGVDRKVRLLDPDTGEPRGILEGASDFVLSLTIIPSADSPAGLIVAGCADHSLRAWRIDTGTLAHELVPPQPSLVGITPGLAPDQVIVATADEQVRLRDLRTGQTLRTFAGHINSSILGVALSPDGQTIYSSGVEAVTRAWDTGSGEQIGAFPGHGSGSATVLCSPDGRRVVTTMGIPQFVARVWNATNGVLERDLTGHRSWLLSAAFSADGQRLATGSDDKEIRLWDPETGASIRTLRGHTAQVRCLAFSPDHRLLASGGGIMDETVRIWDLETGTTKHVFTPELGPVMSVRFSPAGDELLVAFESGFLVFWDPVTGQRKRDAAVATGFLNEAVYSPDASLIVTVEGWPHFIARIWDTRGMALLRVLAGHTGPVEAVAISNDGTRVVTAADRVRLWDIADLTGRLTVGRLPEGLELRWNRGSLQHSPAPTGPWVELPAAVSPWVVPTELGQHYFRVRLPTITPREPGTSVRPRRDFRRWPAR